MLKYGADAKESQLTSQLWLKDVSGSLSDADVQGGGNTALYERARHFELSNLVDLQGPIYHDLFQMDRYILNQVGVSVRFYRAKPEYY